MRVGVKIKRWAAWAPGVENKLAWREWARGNLLFVGEGVPPLEYVPAMQRRRMSLLSKIVLQAVHDCLGEASYAMQSVFSSRHGEIVRTATLLQSLAEEEPLSPAAFSMSVHSTSAGLYSILAKEVSPSTTVSAGRDSFPLAMIEAYSRSVQKEGEDVLLVYGDTILPELFGTCRDEEMVDHALALLVCADSEEPDFTLSLHEVSGGETSKVLFPHSLAFIRFLSLSNQTHLVLNSKQRQWHWSKVHAGS